MAESLGVAYVDVAAKLASDFSSSLSRQIESKGGLGKVGAKAGKMLAKGVAVGFAAVGGATAALTKGALDAYASYEQLSGGIETLFKDSGDAVMENASKAFKTAGMSANTYMETVTSFSASLLQSLGGDTKAAADYADRAVVDMSDNANKMGSSIESIQNAYQGFAKQNYTMLDNLKLGYGGTQSEMQRLIADAAKMTDTQKKLGVTVDASSMSFGNIVNAISVMQDSMGIAGTTSKEAASTIEGSVNSMKSAWENLLAGLGDSNADIDKLVNDFVDTAVVAAENIIPRIGIILESVGGALQRNEGKIRKAGEKLFKMLAKAVGPAIPGIIDALSVLVTRATLSLIMHIPQMIKAAGKLFLAIAKGVGLAVVEVGYAVGRLFDKVVAKAREKFEDFKSAGKRIVEGIVEGIGNGANWVKDKVKEVCNNALDTLKSFFGIHSPSRLMAQMGGYMMQGLANGIGNGERIVRGSVDSVNRSIVSGFSPVGASSARGGVTINLNYTNDADANQMVYDIAAGLRRLNMTGAY